MNNQELQNKIDELENKLNTHQHNIIDGTLSINKTSFVNISLTDTQPQTSTNYGLIFVATRPCFIKAISEVHSVAGTDAGAVELQIEKLQGTTALGSGDNVLNTAFNLKSIANTVVRGELNKNKKFLGLKIGDRLALLSSGVLTAIKGLNITLEIQFI